MMSYEQKLIQKNQYYGLTNGQILGCDLSRKEIYVFKIYRDGSSTVMIKTSAGRYYTYGNIRYCQKQFRTGQHFCNTSAQKQYILSKAFVSVLAQ